MMCVYAKVKRKMLPVTENRSISETSDSVKQFKPEEIKSMTRKFSAKKQVADNKFASVYKCFLPDGKIVAVKHLKPGALQQEFFMAEIDRIKCASHPNLIPLLGYCCTGGFQTLVFEFAQNKNLSYHLQGGSGLSWDIRVKIVIGVAHALIYLHDRGFIHRDIKPSNILLNENYEALVADFGCTKLSRPCVWSSKIEDPEYIAPEYAAGGRWTEKSDVYSFGVVLLEILSGRTIDEELLDEYDGMVTWVRRHFLVINLFAIVYIYFSVRIQITLVLQGKAHIADALEKDDFSKLVDLKLHGVYDKSMVYKMVKVIAQSVDCHPENRPTMSEVLETLEGQTDFSYRLIRRTESLSRDKLYARLPEKILKKRFQRRAQKSAKTLPSKRKKPRATHDPMATRLPAPSPEYDESDDPILEEMLLHAADRLNIVKHRE